MNLTEFAKEVHGNAVDHGWWDDPRAFGEVVALCHSELSEALEEYRSGKPMAYCNNKHCECAGDMEACVHVCGFRAGTGKPEGIAVEMADCIIRILDWCGKEGVDIDAIVKLKHEYNKKRPYRHGGKKL